MEAPQLTTQIVKDLTAKNLREPTFEVDSETVPETPVQISIRARPNDAARDLISLVNGLRNHARNLRTLLVRSGGLARQSRQQQEIAEQAGMDEDCVTYFSRMLATDGVFRKWKRMFKHTSRSSLHLRDKVDEFFRAASETFANRFASVMAGVSRLERHFETLKESPPWNESSRDKFIDVGGGPGYMSVSLARLLRTILNLELIVQNSDLIGRVTSVPHDFFNTQPNDVDCIRIFRALVPALEKSPLGAPLLINDALLAALGEASRFHIIHMRQVDIIVMLVTLGAKQRTEEQFRRRIHGKGNVGLIEAHLDIDTARHTEGLVITEASKDASGDDQEQDTSAVANQQKRIETCL
ncbi:hypothetical protein IQ07DRAFT_626232 [Pyrenochaeta sp. DS3sAY3a]|nr:hypothetical protein IQ07DRAFT_626232 [Pyrenochaeta sp. DS3sAY3a]